MRRGEEDCADSIRVRSLPCPGKIALTGSAIGAIITAREIEVACFNSSPFDVADTGEKG